eukprot:1159000-Pelagomonas_calceolata.AAC.4
MGAQNPKRYAGGVVHELKGSSTMLMKKQCLHLCQPIVVFNTQGSECSIVLSCAQLLQHRSQ